MKRIWAVASVICLIIQPSRAQVQDASVESISSYQNWGWEVLVQKNGLITVATVPAIGARIMQYDLGDHPSIYVNTQELGKTYTPRNGSWYNFGGYKTWPAPQDRWNWPPPPTLDYGNYNWEILVSTADSAVILVSGPTEQWRAPGIRFERKTTIYRGSSRVKVDQTIINEGSTAASWSVWDVTQQITSHPGKNDYENFWVYFPLNPDSRYGSTGVRVSASSNAWKGEVAPGIYGVQYLPEGKKIFADSYGGWVCYVDELDEYAYAKTFAVEQGADYPDQGATVEVWLNNSPLYLEEEVLSPIREMAAQGGRYTFTENWWAAKISGPILHVNNLCATAAYLDYDSGEKALKGQYGVFHVGTARLAFLAADASVLSEGVTHNVTPLQSFQLAENISIPANAETVELRLYDAQGKDLGAMDAAEVKNITSVERKSRSGASDFELDQNYPNPFNPVTTIQFSLVTASQVSLKIFDVNGKEVSTLISRRLPAGDYRVKWDASGLANGVYIARFRAGDYWETKKLILIK